MVEIESTIIRLGEKDYTIQAATYIRSKPWRKRLLDDIKPLFEQVGDIQGIRFDTPADLLKLMPVAEDLLIGGIDKIFELLIMYSPVLEAEREYIEAHSTEKQIFLAFQRVLRLQDFFGLMGQANRQLGLKMTGISSNLPLANGE